MKELAKALKDRARELNLTNAEVARRAGLLERRYGNYVAGVREPDLATFMRIADVLETSPDALLGVTKAKKVTDKDRLIDQLTSAAKTLTKVELDVVVRQVTALTRD
jgi:transcriptional regulator with XRE-family HTH domain